MDRTTTSPELSPTRIWTVTPCAAGPPRRSAASRPACERGVARPHGVVLVGHRRAEQRHDPVAHDLVDGALVAVDGLHHPFEHGIEELPRLLGIAVGEQLHRALQVGEEHGDLLALALERGLRGEDLLGEVLRGVGLRGGEPRSRGGAADSPVGCAHSGQNFAAGDSCRRTWRTPAPAARRTPRRTSRPPRFSCWHRGHVMAVGARLRPDRSHPFRQAERAA